MKYVYQRKGGPILTWDRTRAPGWASGSGRAADARSLGGLGAIDLIPKAGGPEIVSVAGGNYEALADDSLLGGDAVRMAAVGLAAYHGYKRNGTNLSALAWGLCGYLSPLITGAVAVAQGFAKKKGA